MPRRKKTSEEPIGVGMTSMRMKKKKPLGSNYLVDIEPLTENQKRLFSSYAENKHLVAYGCAGTGKTFITLYNALKDVLDENTPYENVYIVRSLIGLPLARLVFFLVTMKINLLCIKFHTSPW